MRFLIGIFVTIGLIILILVLLLRGGGDSTTQVKSLKLSNYATSGSSAHYIIDGPITADQNHEEIKIDVDADQVILTVYKGYQGNVIKQETFSNNVDAYTIFLKAIQNEGFTLSDANSKVRDERGICPLGQRVIYSFNDGSKEVRRSWSTSCGIATFKGKIGAVRTLFQSQVPDYGKHVNDSRLNSFDSI